MDRKEALRQYKENPPLAGVFAVRNVAEGKALVGATPNVAGRLNRERFSLEMGDHTSKQLQADWNRLGPDAFVIELLDEIEEPEDPATDLKEELEELRQMWIEKLGLAPEQLYKMVG